MTKKQGSVADEAKTSKPELPKAKAQWAKLDANPNIVVVETRIVDNAACAARDFTLGETVFKEEPLIVLPRDKVSCYHFAPHKEQGNGKVLIDGPFRQHFCRPILSFIPEPSVYFVDTSSCPCSANRMCRFFCQGGGSQVSLCKYSRR